jgi:hypothetical protein
MQQKSRAEAPPYYLVPPPIMETVIISYPLHIYTDKNLTVEELAEGLLVFTLVFNTSGGGY